MRSANSSVNQHSQKNIPTSYGKSSPFGDTFRRSNHPTTFTSPRHNVHTIRRSQLSTRPHIRYEGDDIPSYEAGTISNRSRQPQNVSNRDHQKAEHQQSQNILDAQHFTSSSEPSGYNEYAYQANHTEHSLEEISLMIHNQTKWLFKTTPQSYEQSERSLSIVGLPSAMEKHVNFFSLSNWLKQYEHAVADLLGKGEIGIYSSISTQDHPTVKSILYRIHDDLQRIPDISIDLHHESLTAAKYGLTLPETHQHHVQPDYSAEIYPPRFKHLLEPFCPVIEQQQTTEAPGTKKSTSLFSDILNDEEHDDYNNGPHGITTADIDLSKHGFTLRSLTLVIRALLAVQETTRATVLSLYLLKNHAIFPGNQQLLAPLFNELVSILSRQGIKALPLMFLEKMYELNIIYPQKAVALLLCARSAAKDKNISDALKILTFFLSLDVNTMKLEHVTSIIASIGATYAANGFPRHTLQLILSLSPFIATKMAPIHIITSPDFIDNVPAAQLSSLLEEIVPFLPTRVPQYMVSPLLTLAIAAKSPHFATKIYNRRMNVTETTFASSLTNHQALTLDSFDQYIIQEPDQGSSRAFVSNTTSDASFPLSRLLEEQYHTITTPESDQVYTTNTRFVAQYIHRHYLLSSIPPSIDAATDPLFVYSSSQSDSNSTITHTPFQFLYQPPTQPEHGHPSRHRGGAIQPHDHEDFMLTQLGITYHTIFKPTSYDHIGELFSQTQVDDNAHAKKLAKLELLVTATDDHGVVSTELPDAKSPHPALNNASKPLGDLSSPTFLPHLSFEDVHGLSEFHSYKRYISSRLFHTPAASRPAHYQQITSPVNIIPPSDAPISPNISEHHTNYMKKLNPQLLLSFLQAFPIFTHHITCLLTPFVTHSTYIYDDGSSESYNEQLVIHYQMLQALIAGKRTDLALKLWLTQLHSFTSTALIHPVVDEAEVLNGPPDDILAVFYPAKPQSRSDTSLPQRTYTVVDRLLGEFQHALYRQPSYWNITDSSYLTTADASSNNKSQGTQAQAKDAHSQRADIFRTKSLQDAIAIFQTIFPLQAHFLSSVRSRQLLEPQCVFNPIPNRPPHAILSSHTYSHYYYSGLTQMMNASTHNADVLMILWTSWGKGPISSHLNTILPFISPQLMDAVQSYLDTSLDGHITPHEQPGLTRLLTQHNSIQRQDTSIISNHLISPMHKYSLPATSAWNKMPFNALPHLYSYESIVDITRQQQPEGSPEVLLEALSHPSRLHIASIAHHILRALPSSYLTQFSQYINGVLSPFIPHKLRISTLPNSYNILSSIINALPHQGQKVFLTIFNPFAQYLALTDPVIHRAIHIRLFPHQHPTQKPHTTLSHTDEDPSLDTSFRLIPTKAKKYRPYTPAFGHNTLFEYQLGATPSTQSKFITTWSPSRKSIDIEDIKQLNDPQKLDKFISQTPSTTMLSAFVTHALPRVFSFTPPAMTSFNLIVSDLTDESDMIKKGLHDDEQHQHSNIDGFSPVMPTQFHSSETSVYKQQMHYNYLTQHMNTHLGVNQTLRHFEHYRYQQQRQLLSETNANAHQDSFASLYKGHVSESDYDSYLLQQYPGVEANGYSSSEHEYWASYKHQQDLWHQSHLSKIRQQQRQHSIFQLSSHPFKAGVESMLSMYYNEKKFDRIVNTVGSLLVIDPFVYPTHQRYTLEFDAASIEDVLEYWVKYQNIYHQRASPALVLQLTVLHSVISNVSLTRMISTACLAVGAFEMNQKIWDMHYFFTFTGRPVESTPRFKSASTSVSSASQIPRGDPEIDSDDQSLIVKQEDAKTRAEARKLAALKEFGLAGDDDADTTFNSTTGGVFTGLLSGDLVRQREQERQEQEARQKQQEEDLRKQQQMVVSQKLQLPHIDCCASILPAINKPGDAVDPVNTKTSSAPPTEDDLLDQLVSAPSQSNRIQSSKEARDDDVLDDANSLTSDEVEMTSDDDPIPLNMSSFDKSHTVSTACKQLIKPTKIVAQEQKLIQLMTDYADRNPLYLNAIPYTNGMLREEKSLVNQIRQWYGKPRDNALVEQLLGHDLVKTLIFNALIKADVINNDMDGNPIASDQRKDVKSLLIDQYTKKRRSIVTRLQQQLGSISTEKERRSNLFSPNHPRFAELSPSGGGFKGTFTYDMLTKEQKLVLLSDLFDIDYDIKKLYYNHQFIAAAKADEMFAFHVNDRTKTLQNIPSLHRVCMFTLMYLSTWIQTGNAIAATIYLHKSLNDPVWSDTMIRILPTMGHTTFYREFIQNHPLFHIAQHVIALQAHQHPQLSYQTYAMCESYGLFQPLFDTSTLKIPSKDRTVQDRLKLKYKNTIDADLTPTDANLADDNHRLYSTIYLRMVAQHLTGVPLLVNPRMLKTSLTPDVVRVQKSSAPGPASYKVQHHNTIVRDDQQLYSYLASTYHPYVHSFHAPNSSSTQLESESQPNQVLGYSLQKPVPEVNHSAIYTPQCAGIPIAELSPAARRLLGWQYVTLLVSNPQTQQTCSFYQIKNWCSTSQGNLQDNFQYPLFTPKISRAQGYALSQMYLPETPPSVEVNTSGLWSITKLWALKSIYERKLTHLVRIPEHLKMQYHAYEANAAGYAATMASIDPNACNNANTDVVIAGDSVTKSAVEKLAPLTAYIPITPWSVTPEESLLTD